jgi:hypothetical protein
MKSRLDKKMQISLFDDFENIAHNVPHTPEEPNEVNGML